MSRLARWSWLIPLWLGCAEPPPTSHATNPSASASPPATTTLAGSASPAPPQPSQATPLLATYAGPARFREGAPATITVTLTNEGSTPQTLNLFVLGVPQLSLEVRDANDHVVPPLPPPVPPLQMDTAPLAPGASRAFSLSLGAFSPPLPKGRYTVRLRDERAHGTPLSFTVE